MLGLDRGPLPLGFTDYAPVRGTTASFRNNCAPNPNITSDDNGVMGQFGTWGPSGLMTGRMRIEAITDGTANTIMVVEDAGRQGHYVRGRLLGTFSASYPVNLNAAWADYNIKVTVHGTDATGMSISGGCCIMNCNNNDEIYGFHSGGTNVLRADGSVSFLRESVAAGVVAALISRAGGETVSND